MIIFLFQIMLECWNRDPTKRPTFEFLTHMFEDFNISTQNQYMEWAPGGVPVVEPHNFFTTCHWRPPIVAAHKPQESPQSLKLQQRRDLILRKQKKWSEKRVQRKKRRLFLRKIPRAQKTKRTQQSKMDLNFQSGHKLREKLLWDFHVSLTSDQQCIFLISIPN